MNFGQLFNLFAAMVAVAIALSVAMTNIIAALALGLYAGVILLEFESETAREMMEERHREVQLFKLVLLFTAGVVLFL